MTPKDGNDQSPPAASNVRPVAYENEMYRLTQLKAVIPPQKDCIYK